MRCRTLFISILFAGGCGGGDSISPPRPIDASESADGGDPHDADTTPSDDAAEADAPPAPDAGLSPDAGVTCARAPLGEWTGAALIKYEGAGSFHATRADIRWVLDSSEGCIDRYVPTGTVTFRFVDPCDSTVEPGSVQVQPSDGTLTIDRTRNPVAYEIRGATTWDASVTCPGDPPEPPVPVGGPWALGRGTFDGNVLSGGFEHSDDASAFFDFVRVDAPFPDEGPGCAEPPIDHLWSTGAVGGDVEATVTWTRVETSGCTDRLTPSGDARLPSHDHQCTSIVAEPPSVPIAMSDGELVVDRSSRPLRVRWSGATTWEGARTCTLPDGERFIEHGTFGGSWAWFVRAGYDGIAFSGSTTFGQIDYAWSITRLPPPVAASSPAP